MAYTLPVLRGHMGTTDYYLAAMKARELAAVAMMAGELPEWTTWSVFERFQRELAQRRVESEWADVNKRTLNKTCRPAGNVPYRKRSDG